MTPWSGWPSRSVCAQPLIDFHGNYGSPDFPAAAARYTECRLSRWRMQMLESIDEETVDMGRNYLNEDDEPTVLPSRFPNLLVNGSQGIAVGMATNIPPHNLGEVIDATTHLIDHPEASIEDLMRFVKGPDFPPAGFILGRQGSSTPIGRDGARSACGPGRDRGDPQRFPDSSYRTALPGQPPGHPGTHRRAGQQPGTGRHPRHPGPVRR